jgi:hypothetical protein
MSHSATFLSNTISTITMAKIEAYLKQCNKTLVPEATTIPTRARLLQFSLREYSPEVREILSRETKAGWALATLHS